MRIDDQKSLVEMPSVRFDASMRGLFIGGLLAISLVPGCSTSYQPAAKEPDPVYQDRRLSEWLRDFDGTNQAPSQAMAAEAVRHIGVAGMPLIIDCLSTARMEQCKLDAKKWQDRQKNAIYDVPRPPCPRREALAALDALASVAADALPALEKLLHEDPPDPAALYIATRIGPAGVPLLTTCLTNSSKFLRLEAGVCLDLMNSHSEVLYPQIQVGPDAPGFSRRFCEFNLKMAQAAAQVYRAEHPRPSVQEERSFGTPSPPLVAPK